MQSNTKIIFKNYLEQGNKDNNNEENIGLALTELSVTLKISKQLKMWWG